MPAELITVVDIKLPPYSGGDVCLIPRYLAFGVNPVAAHISRYVIDREKPSVPPHYAVLYERLAQSVSEAGDSRLGIGVRPSPPTEFPTLRQH